MILLVSTFGYVLQRIWTESSQSHIFAFLIEPPKAHCLRCHSFADSDTALSYVVFLVSVRVGILLVIALHIGLLCSASKRVGSRRGLLRH